MSQRGDGDKGILKRVFLVGFMCSGKTTVGRLLARSLGWEFADVDEEIERREGMSIPEIFETRGEAYFRELELKVLEEISRREEVVVSTGGGLGSNPRAMEMMKERGLVVWIDIDYEEFRRRCGNDPHRPLLRRGETALRTLLRERSRVYSEAHLKVEGWREPGEIVKLILLNLRAGPS
jgi:shikimate kinase